MDIKLYTAFDPPTGPKVEELTDFLLQHLDEFGDARADIRRAIAYALKEFPSPGGFVVGGYLEDQLVGVVVINRTGMSGYIPENILVYIAVDQSVRGQGIGKKLMHKAIEVAEGDIALHVEPDNPAKFLYEKVGFTNKYLEMRFHKEKNPEASTSATQADHAES
jgi:ribosomal protein S18 acetylase RimI-like enzyme